jgi:hypothetical protein
MKYINDLIEKLLDEVRKLGERSESYTKYYMLDSQMKMMG